MRWLLAPALLVLFAVFCFIQVRLSRMKAFWPGLILPALHLVFAAVMLIIGLNIVRVAHSEDSGGSGSAAASGSVFDAQGNVEEKIEVIPEGDAPHSRTEDVTSASFSVLPLLLYITLPEAAYIIIYISHRKTSRHSHEADKMALLDLE